MVKFFSWVNWLQMVAELDQMAEACRSKLRTVVPNHPAIASPLVPSSEILPESKWDQERCKQLMKCINDVLFNQVCLFCYTVLKKTSDVLVLPFY